MSGQQTTSVTYFPHNGAFVAGTHSKWREAVRTAPLLARGIRNTKPIPGSLFAHAYGMSKLKLNRPLTALLQQAHETMDEGALMAAAEGSANAENLSHLQQILLLRTLGGDPDEYFYLGEAFQKYDAPNLELRKTYKDNPTGAEYRRRLEETPATGQKYSEVQFNVGKLTDKVYTAMEDLLRTVINPQTNTIDSILYGFNWKRNKLAADAISKTSTGPDNSSTIPDLGDIDKLGTDGTAYHSSNRIARKIMENNNAMLKRNDTRMTHILMNPTGYAAYTENTWTKPGGPTGIIADRLNGGGVEAFPGIKGCTAIVDMEIPDGVMYVFNKKQALGVAEGPKTTRRYYDEERDAEVVKYLDFVEFKNLSEDLPNSHGRKYGYKVTYSTSA